MKTLGKKIQYVRKSKFKMSQKEFAKFLDIPQSSLSSHENDKSTPTLEVIIFIAEQCNVSLDWLCGIKTKPKKRDKQLNYNVKCCYCNKESEPHERMVRYENDIYCVDCFMKMHEFNLTCNKCGYEYSTDEKFVEVDGMHFCENCVVDEFEYMG